MVRVLRIALFALVAAMVPVVPVQAAPTDLPGGKTNFVVATGYLKDGRDHKNWVRLGTYAFDAATARVTASMYVWDQRRPVRREGTGVTPDLGCAPVGKWDSRGRRHCEVLTAGGFRGVPSDVRTGSYTLRPATALGAQRRLVIAWGDARPREEWDVAAAGSGLARLEFRGGGGATRGYGYGSTAPLNRGRPMESVYEHPESPAIKLDSYTWTHDRGRTVAQGMVFHHRRFSRCTAETRCLTLAEPSSGKPCSRTSGCPRYGRGGSATGKTDATLQSYLARVSSDRRDSLWQWCTCLAMEHHEPCYRGNSHVNPMLQVLNDDGDFRGWVGVEASFYPYADPEHGPRWHDMLSVFRRVDMG